MVSAYRYAAPALLTWTDIYSSAIAPVLPAWWMQVRGVSTTAWMQEVEQRRSSCRGAQAFPASPGCLPETPVLAIARTGLFRPTGLTTCPFVLRHTQG